MKTARTDITDFHRSVGVQTLLHGGIPLLDILRGRMRVECGKADGGGRERSGAQYRGAEIHATGKQRRWRSEIIGLLRFRENVRDIMALVAPSIQIHRRKENAVRG